MTTDAVKAALVFFVVVIVQAAVVSPVGLAGGTADLVLVTLAGVALLRGSTFGAVAGFYAGFLLDTANLGTLGVSSLLLTLAGYWIGRYGETTGRDRAHAPLVSIAVVTVLYAFGALALHAMLGESVSAQAGLRALPAQILLNLALTVPIYAIVRRLFAAPTRVPLQEVEFS